MRDSPPKSNIFKKFCPSTGKCFFRITLIITGICIIALIVYFVKKSNKNKCSPECPSYQTCVDKVCKCPEGTHEVCGGCFPNCPFDRQKVNCTTKACDCPTGSLFLCGNNCYGSSNMTEEDMCGIEGGIVDCSVEQPDLYSPICTCPSDKVLTECEDGIKRCLDPCPNQGQSGRSDGGTNDQGVTTEPFIYKGLERICINNTCVCPQGFSAAGDGWCTGIACENGGAMLTDADGKPTYCDSCPTGTKLISCSDDVQVCCSVGIESCDADTSMCCPGDSIEDDGKTKCCPVGLISHNNNECVLSCGEREGDPLICDNEVNQSCQVLKSDNGVQMTNWKSYLESNGTDFVENDDKIYYCATRSSCSTQLSDLPRFQGSPVFWWSSTDGNSPEEMLTNLTNGTMSLSQVNNEGEKAAGQGSPYNLTYDDEQKFDTPVNKDRPKLPKGAWCYENENAGDNLYRFATIEDSSGKCSLDDLLKIASSTGYPVRMNVENKEGKTTAYVLSSATSGKDSLSPTFVCPATEDDLPTNCRESCNNTDGEYQPGKIVECSSLAEQCDLCPSKNTESKNTELYTCSNRVINIDKQNKVNSNWFINGYGGINEEKYVEDKEIDGLTLISENRMSYPGCPVGELKEYSKEESSGYCQKWYGDNFNGYVDNCKDKCIQEWNCHNPTSDAKAEPVYGSMNSSNPAPVEMKNTTADNTQFTTYFGSFDTKERCEKVCGNQPYFIQTLDKTKPDPEVDSLCKDSTHSGQLVSKSRGGGSGVIDSDYRNTTEYCDHLNPPTPGYYYGYQSCCDAGKALDLDVQDGDSPHSYIYGNCTQNAVCEYDDGKIKNNGEYLVKNGDHYWDANGKCQIGVTNFCDGCRHSSTIDSSTNLVCRDKCNDDYRQGKVCGESEGKVVDGTTKINYNYT